MAKYIFYVSTGYVGSKREEEVEICDEDIAECETDDEVEDLVQEVYLEWLHSHIDSGFYKKD